MFQSLTTNAYIGLGLGYIVPSTITFLPTINTICCHDAYTEMMKNDLVLFFVGLVMVEGTLPLNHTSKHIDPINVESDIG
jgi:hypothetical protein